MKYALKSIFISWDFLVAISVAIALYLFLPPLLPAKIVKPIYEISVSVLSVVFSVFSVFFAALAVLITAGDNEFVRFLEEDGLYMKIIFTFKVTLIALFVALLFSIFSFVTILPYTETDLLFVYSKEMVVVFSFSTLYALFASVNSTMDAIKYAEFRASFLRITKK